MLKTTQSSTIASWRDVVNFIVRQVPDVFTKGRFNFITIHYFYIIGLSILLSVIMYGIGDMRYIDALFHSAGSCTQSGLNTIDVNTMYTGQQVVLYFGAMFCNPIVIHGSVVFVRLYWFEKRFKDVVKEARALRRTKSRSRSVDMTNNPADVEAGDDVGVRDRAMKMLYNTGRRMSGRVAPPTRNDDSATERNGSGSSDTSPNEKDENPLRRRSSPSIEDLRLPQQLNAEQHIKILEMQRNPHDSGTLRIPSPREYDQGEKPENIDEVLDTELDKRTSQNTNERSAGNGNVEGHMPTHLTFDEPEIHRNRTHRPAYLARAHSKRTPTMGSKMSQATRAGTGSFAKSELMPYLSYQPTVARNSFFVNLTEEQREELGGIEYRALKTLALILLGYFFGFHLLGIISLLPWILRTGTWDAVLAKYSQGEVWWAFFTAASAFNDLGFTLTPTSMIEFNYATWPLLIMSYLIVIGNTGFPCMLRFMIWALSKMAPVGGALWEELQFLLDHPRRCFTLLFPRAATWWLFAVLVILNGLDLIFFIVLDLSDETVVSLPGWYRFLDGLFQAFSTRTAGFAVVNLADLHPAVQVSYLIMMYISVLPIAISMRRTNVYEEKSLGIYSGGDDNDDGKEPSYVGAHLRKQLGFDLWYVFLGLFIIAIVEGPRLESGDPAFSLFAILFEIVSAYGTVGLSLGYPTINASLSAEFHTLSKLVIIAMQVRGRHRGLPYELDRAVLLPSQSLHDKETQEAERIVSRRQSFLSTTSAVDGHLDASRFRSETGLSSNADSVNTHRRERARFGARRGSTHNATDGYSHDPRRELGTAMFRLATTPERIRERLGSDSS